MQAFTLTQPVGPALPVLASIPHSGTYVPDDIRVLFANKSVAHLPMTDWFLYHLYDFLPGLGVSVVAANVSRYVIDMNRSPLPLELYPGRFETKLVADSDFQGRSIFSSYPSQQQIDLYTQQVHVPYHRALQQCLTSLQQAHGKVYLFDLHSIAKSATLIHAELDKDIYLGDRDGNSCSGQWTQMIADEFMQHKFSVQKNQPYKGGYITHHYGQDANVEALQIEMNQEVYMQSEHAGDAQLAVQSQRFIQAKTRLEALFVALLESLEH
ncbi:MAG: hypothetical protein HKN88_03325 [Gammaproteobacteria bacterium]|nr:N-formylglutamate amidohydrolase [Gammaproteobacteria bacterium]NNC97084.1 hypothetical protein [Gammaproteobacteria bacterium]NNM14071.1 hypothetical protein [Gammaproteobacteria bacterium]